jgi:hypothetical protein
MRSWPVSWYYYTSIHLDTLRKIMQNLKLGYKVTWPDFEQSAPTTTPRKQIT